MGIRRVAILTAGGFAPCLSSAVGGLIERYTEVSPETEIITYQYGYHGLLTGNYTVIDEQARREAATLHRFGGSPIGNSRVKLTNAKDLTKRGLIPEGVDPLEYAAHQLRKDGVDVLHTIGGDDTNTTAADLAKFLKTHDYHLCVVGLPKTIDNDVIPVHQSLGAYTAAEHAARFAMNVIGEHRSNPRMLIVHEVMGRNCGWLTAASALRYRQFLDQETWAPSLGLQRERWDIHAIQLPELRLNIEEQAQRLKRIMDEQGNVNVFFSEGAGIDEVIAAHEAEGETIQRDPFGHVKLDTINPGAWYAQQMKQLLGAEKVMVQKSGYYSRAARANEQDLALIKQMTDKAVESALAGVSGVIGQDEEQNNELRAIEFPRIKGGKPFDLNQQWFIDLMAGINQPIQPVLGE